MTNVKYQMTNESLMTNKKFNIQERTLEFAAKTAKFINLIPKNQVTIEYIKQLIRSSASVGANLEEADGTLSKKDFINKIAIARREARESKYWLDLIRKTEYITNLTSRKDLDWLINESREIMLILNSIINKTRANNNINCTN